MIIYKAKHVGHLSVFTPSHAPLVDPGFIYLSKYWKHYFSYIGNNKFGVTSLQQQLIAKKSEEIPASYTTYKHLSHIEKGNAYLAQYPVRITVQSALHFIPDRPVRSNEIATLQLIHNNYLYSDNQHCEYPGTQY